MKEFAYLCVVDAQLTLQVRHDIQALDVLRVVLQVLLSHLQLGDDAQLALLVLLQRNNQIRQVGVAGPQLGLNARHADRDTLELLRDVQHQAVELWELVGRARREIDLVALVEQIISVNTLVLEARELVDEVEKTLSRSRSSISFIRSDRWPNLVLRFQTVQMISRQLSSFRTSEVEIEKNSIQINLLVGFSA